MIGPSARTGASTAAFSSGDLLPQKFTCTLKSDVGFHAGPLLALTPPPKNKQKKVVTENPHHDNME